MIQDVRDKNILDKRVGLMYKHMRYKCMECGEVFTEQYDSIPEKGRMATNLIEYIALKAEKNSFTSIHEELDISDFFYQKHIHGAYKGLA